MERFSNETRTENLRERATGAREQAAMQAEQAMGEARGRLRGAAIRGQEAMGRLGQTLKERDYHAISDGVTGSISRHPVAAIMVGAGIGFMIGRWLERR